MDEREYRYDYVAIRFSIDGNELATEVPSREIPRLIDRWFLAIGEGGDQDAIDALTARMKAANDKLDAVIQAYTPKP